MYPIPCCYNNKSLLTLPGHSIYIRYTMCIYHLVYTYVRIDIPTVVCIHACELPDSQCAFVHTYTYVFLTGSGEQQIERRKPIRAYVLRIYIHTHTHTTPIYSAVYTVKEWTTSSSHFNSCFSITNEWQAHLSTAPSGGSGSKSFLGSKAAAAELKSLVWFS